VGGRINHLLLARREGGGDGGTVVHPPLEFEMQPFISIFFFEKGIVEK
jgi:hypothetical protein